MARTIHLQNADDPIRQMVESCRAQNEECVIQDDQNQPVAVVMPIGRYESYQIYLKQREKDFEIFNRIDEQMKDYDPDFIDAQIDKAVAEVKAESRAKSKNA